MWAVGDYGNTQGGITTLAEHWDGTSWSIVSTPSPTIHAQLNGVSAVSTTRAFAIGKASLFPNDKVRPCGGTAPLGGRSRPRIWSRRTIWSRCRSSPLGGMGGGLKRRRHHPDRAAHPRRVDGGDDAADLGHGVVGQRLHVERPGGLGGRRFHPAVGQSQTLVEVLC